MRLSGIEAITLPTQRSHRSVIIISATIYFVISYNVPITDLKIMGISAPVEFFGAVSWAILFFSTANHIINWFGDFLSYQNWYQKNEVPLSTWDGIGETVSPIEHVNVVLDRLKNLAENDKNNFKKNAIHELQDLDKRISDARRSFRKLHIYAKFYIFVWYLFIPAISAALAAREMVMFDAAV